MEDAFDGPISGLTMSPDAFRERTLLVAGICTGLAVILSYLLIKSHFFCWQNAEQQKRIILIILMVPLFAVDSYVGLVDIEAGEVVITALDAIKECYEAVVITAFLGLMSSYLGLPVGGKDKSLVVPDHLKGRELHHSFPVTLFSHSMRLDSQSIRTLYLCTLQFVILRPVISLAVIALELSGLYTAPTTWLINLLLNVSVSVAVYALVLFYHAFAKELAPHRPLAKFLCVKGVVFFAFWQGLILQVLAWGGVLHEGHWPYTVRQVEDALQNFLVCAQMLFFACCHWYAFGVEDYRVEAPIFGKKNAGVSLRTEGKKDT